MAAEAGITRADVIVLLWGRGADRLWHWRSARGECEPGLAPQRPARRAPQAVDDAGELSCRKADPDAACGAWRLICDEAIVTPQTGDPMTLIRLCGHRPCRPDERGAGRRLGTLSVQPAELVAKNPGVPVALAAASVRERIEGDV